MEALIIMEARKCPDCKTLTYFDRELIDKDHPEDGECLICQQCGYAIYEEDEGQRRWNRFKIESEIIESLNN